MLSFKELIDPIPQETFFSEFWEKKALHISRAKENYYASLVTPLDLDELISSGHLRYPALQIAKDGYYFPPETYMMNVRTGGEQFTGVILLDRVNAHYRAGATVSLPAVQRASRKLEAFTASLEQELDHAVQANAYLTAGGTPGFKPHYDTHEIFVLQIGGRKRWMIYEPPIELPYRSQIFNPQTYVLPKDPTMDVEVNPGDLLYLPRGYVHTTETTPDIYSSHITLAVTVYTWIDLAIEYLQDAKATPEFRKALPCGFSRSDKGVALTERVMELMDELHKRTDGNTLVHRFVKQVEARRQLQEAQFESDFKLSKRASPKC